MSTDVANGYLHIFTQEDKAKAFDKIAERYYQGNFGMMQKSDFEVLLFSIYLEQILNKTEDEMDSYSDYLLSKQLGISQSKVSNLKMKKQLQYPREFDWKEVFYKSIANALYEGGKIKMHIKDINLYSEIKNAVEQSGGFVDGTLNRNLLQMSPFFFVELLCKISPEDDRKIIMREIRTKCRAKEKDAHYLESEPIGRQLKGFGIDFLKDFLLSISSEPLTHSIKAVITLFAALLERCAER